MRSPSRAISVRARAERGCDDGSDLLRCAPALPYGALERFDREHAGMALAVEPRIDSRLDAGAQRSECECDEEGRPCDRPVGAAAHRDPEPERHGDVGGRQHEGHRHVDERPVDEALDRVQLVADHGDADGDGDRGLHEEQEREEQIAGQPVGETGEDRGREEAEEAAVDEPGGDQCRRPGEPEGLQPPSSASSSPASGSSP